MARSVTPRKSRFGREQSSRSFVRQIHIFTEGDATEKEYLDLIKDMVRTHDTQHLCAEKFRINIKTSRNKSSPKNLRKTIRREIKHFEGKELNEIWVLMDQDDWPSADISKLRDDEQIKASTDTYNVLISRPKFEIWLLLHFDAAFGLLTSDDVDARLKKFIPNYGKHCDKTWFTLDKISTAIRNAKKLRDLSHDVGSDVYRLIEHIFELSKILTPSDGK